MDYLDDLYALRSDPEVMRYVSDGNTQTKEQVEAFIKAGTGYFEKYGLDSFCVFEKGTGDFVGQSGLFHYGFNTKQDDIELAYRLHKKYWGLGYATEASKALIDYGFQELKLPSIISLHYAENTKSKNVLMKCGFVYTKNVEYKGKRIPCYEFVNPLLR